jgi:hypothetical protein
MCDVFHVVILPIIAAVVLGEDDLLADGPYACPIHP